MGTNQTADVRKHRHLEPHTKPDTPRPHGRRALRPVDDPVAVAVTDPTTTQLRRLALSTLAAGAMLATAGGLTAGAVTKTAHRTSLEAKSDESTAAITAANVKLKLDKVDVATAPSPTPTATPTPVVEAPAVAPAPVQAPAPAPVVEKPAAVAKPAPVAAAQAPASDLSRGQRILSAAIGQIGQMQDCTMLVTRSLAAVGITFHGWPVEYFSLGTQVSAADAVAGDLIYYADGGAGVAHIAVYKGGGRAIHGGYNGNQTVEWSAQVGSGPVFIRLR